WSGARCFDRGRHRPRDLGHRRWRTKSDRENSGEVKTTDLIVSDVMSGSIVYGADAFWRSSAPEQRSATADRHRRRTPPEDCPLEGETNGTTAHIARRSTAAITGGANNRFEPRRDVERLRTYRPSAVESSPCHRPGFPRIRALE